MNTHTIQFKTWFNLCDWLNENFTNPKLVGDTIYADDMVMKIVNNRELVITYDR